MKFSQKFFINILTVFFFVPVFALDKAKEPSKKPELVKPDSNKAPAPQNSPDIKNNFLISGAVLVQAPNMDFYFTPESAGLSEVNFDSNTSMLLGLSAQTTYGAFSLALPIHHAGERDTSDPNVTQKYTSALDFRYENLFGKILWRFKYLKYSGFYRNNDIPSEEVLRDDIELSTIEATGFYYFTPEKFPVQNQTLWETSFKRAGTSVFTYGSIYRNHLKSNTSLLTPSYDLALGEFKGLSRLESSGLIAGLGYGMNTLFLEDHLNWLWVIGVGGDIHQRKTTGSLGVHSAVAFGMSVVVESAMNYRLSATSFIGFSANYITQSTTLNQVDITTGNMDIKMYYGMSF